MLTEEQIQEVLRSPNGSFALLELVRAGRIDAESAVTVLERHEKTPLLNRIFFALLDTFFGGGSGRRYDL